MVHSFEIASHTPQDRVDVLLASSNKPVTCCHIKDAAATVWMAMKLKQVPTDIFFQMRPKSLTSYPRTSPSGHRVSMGAPVTIT